MGVCVRHAWCSARVVCTAAVNRPTRQPASQGPDVCSTVSKRRPAYIHTRARPRRQVLAHKTVVAGWSVAHKESLRRPQTRTGHMRTNHTGSNHNTTLAATANVAECVMGHPSLCCARCQLIRRELDPTKFTAKTSPFQARCAARPPCNQRPPPSLQHRARCTREPLAALRFHA